MRMCGGGCQDYGLKTASCVARRGTAPQLLTCRMMVALLFGPSPSPPTVPAANASQTRLLDSGH
jgi:hypothetical protein